MSDFLSSANVKGIYASLMEVGRFKLEIRQFRRTGGKTDIDTLVFVL
jgi:hypothetical protein